MKINKNLLRPIFGLGLLTLILVSCEKDFVSLDSDVVNNDIATNFGNGSQRFNVKTYTKVLGPVQTSNLPLYGLGVFEDPFYGKTTASIVTQVTSSAINPNFGTNPVLDSVVLTIPYFSRSIGITEDNVLEFALDSVFGNNPMKLTIYENKFFLRDFDPNLGFNEPQSYFSNGATSETEFMSPSILEGTFLQEISTFVPDNRLIVLKNAEGEVQETLNPAIRVKFDNLDFWQTKILDKQGQTELSNVSNFNNHFRGLYFKAEPINGSGSFILLNLSQVAANITLYYKKDPFTEGLDRESATFNMTLLGNRVNLLENNPTFPLTDGDAENGDEQLFLKGMQGSIAALNLFEADENGNSAILSELKASFVDPVTNNKRKLLNEAQIVVFVDQAAVANLVEPPRLYLYDLTNNVPLADYFLDISNTAFPGASLLNHLGPLQTESDGNTGIKYKFRITQHMSNIIFNDSTNVKLGLAVSGNVNLETIQQYNVLSPNSDFKKVPLSSLITPRSTILHGSQSPIEEKRVFLEIFYTEPEN